MNLLHVWTQNDGIGRAVALLLLAMSVASWFVIVWKALLLAQARRSVARGLAAFWQGSDLAAATTAAQTFDSARLLAPLLAAAQSPASPLLAQADRGASVTRALRDALAHSVAPLLRGQTLLASVASTAPFVGLLGTVWGIFHALTGLSSATGLTIERVAGPVGEALIMTAAGLAVAIPAVLAYNVFARHIEALQAQLEGFAHDLRELLVAAR